MNKQSSITSAATVKTIAGSVAGFSYAVSFGLVRRPGLSRQYRAAVISTFMVNETMKYNRYRTYRVPTVDFLRTARTASDVHDLATKLGYSSSIIWRRLRYLRARGIVVTFANTVQVRQGAYAA